MVCISYITLGLVQSYGMYQLYNVRVSTKLYTGQQKLRIIFLNCFQKKYECNFDHLFSPYVYNTVMLPVGPCIS
jgi:hypothetical protein